MVFAITFFIPTSSRKKEFRSIFEKIGKSPINGLNGMKRTTKSKERLAEQKHPFFRFIDSSIEFSYTVGIFYL